MKLYLLKSSYPELAPLEPDQRKRVYSACWRRFTREHRPAFWAFSGMLFFASLVAIEVSCWLFIGKNPPSEALVPNFWLRLLVLMPLFGGFIAGLISLAFSHFVIDPKLRPYFSKYIEEHQPELTGAA
jgi:Zn-dependent protease with chaperone function